jgi:hypothetical protein
MGLATSVIRWMVSQHGERPWSGPVLTLGVQDVAIGYAELLALFRAERVCPVPVPVAQQVSTTSVLLQRSAGGSKCVHPRVFFQMLGLPAYDDLDFADFERPTLVHNLNEPIPPAWRGRYGLVVDGGTTEHIFDVRSVLTNIVSLLQIGGEVLHIAPLSGWVNHGFYQLNPCLFYDFYAGNGFEVISAALVLLPRSSGRAEVIRPYRYTPDSFDLDDADYRTLFCFRACKRSDQTLVLPIQGYYRQLVAQLGRNAG